MKLIATILLILLCINNYAQTLNIAYGLSGKLITNKPDCNEKKIDKKELQIISDQMYQVGDPRFIAVDLIKDGWMATNIDTIIELYIGINEQPNSYNDLSYNIPNDVRQAYAEKFISFTKSLKEPPNPKGWYKIRLINSPSICEIKDKSSWFRKNHIEQLRHIGLTQNGYLRIFKELIKDGIVAPHNSPNITIGKEGLFVRKKRIPKELRSKYKALFKHEIGFIYEESETAMHIGWNESQSIAKRITEIEERINDNNKK